MLNTTIGIQKSPNKNVEILKVIIPLREMEMNSFLLNKSCYLLSSVASLLDIEKMKHLVFDCVGDNWVGK